MSDLGFEQMLAVHNQAFRDAEEFSNWMPPDGEYLVSVVKADKGTSSKKAEDKEHPMGWWKLTGQIISPENPDLNGEKFQLGFYSTKAMGLLKGQARALNRGVPVENLAEASVVILGSQGKILRVKVETSTNSDKGKEYRNCYIQEVIDTQPAETTVTETTPPTA